MRNFLVNVNGTQYEVAVEEIDGKAAPAVKAAPAAAPVAAPVAAAPAGGAKVTAPMPGNILDIKVKVGDMVEANTVVIMLEAMKMENEIFAGAAGKVTAINVTKGSTVNSGDVLVVIG